MVSFLCIIIFAGFLDTPYTFDFLSKTRYILWTVALLEACDVTNNGCHLGFYQELAIRLINIFVLYMKNNT